MIKLHTNQLREKLNIQKKTEDSQNNNRPVVPAGWHPQILADQLTLSQPGGNRLCPRITIGTSGFPDLPTALKGLDEKQSILKKLSKDYDKESEKKIIRILNVDCSRDPTYL